MPDCDFSCRGYHHLKTELCLYMQGEREVSRWRIIEPESLNIFFARFPDGDLGNFALVTSRENSIGFVIERRQWPLCGFVSFANAPGFGSFYEGIEEAPFSDRAMASDENLGMLMKTGSSVSGWNGIDYVKILICIQERE